MCSIRNYCHTLMTFEFYPEVFEKSSNVKFHESPSITSQAVPCGWTDGEDRRDEANIIFVILANVPKMTNLHFY